MWTHNTLSGIIRSILPSNSVPALGPAAASGNGGATRKAAAAEIYSGAQPQGWPGGRASVAIDGPASQPNNQTWGDFSSFAALTGRCRPMIWSVWVFPLHDLTPGSSGFLVLRPSARR